MTRPRAKVPDAETSSAAYDMGLWLDARERLRAWTAPEPAQERLRRGFLAHLEAHPDAMARSGPPAHLTASVVVLDSSVQRVLLTLHRKAGEWFQFGGHHEVGDASVWHAADREAREESGVAELTVLPDLVQLDRHALVGAFGRCREHLDIRFAAVVPDGAEPVVSDESLAVRWWPRDALPEGTRAELAPLVDAAAAAISRR